MRDSWCGSSWIRLPRSRPRWLHVSTMKTTTTNDDARNFEIQHALNSSRRLVGDAREELAKEARDLARNLLREAEKVEKDPTYRPNSLGIVQGAGANVDRACAAIYERTAMVERIERLIATIQKTES